MEEIKENNNEKLLEKNSLDDELLRNKNSISDNSIGKLSSNKEEEKESIKDFISMDDLYENVEDSEPNLVSNEKNGKSINELFYLKDIKEFNRADYINRKYNKNNVEYGKLFFKYRYIKKKIEKSANKVRSTMAFTRPGNIFDKRFSVSVKGCSSESFGETMELNKNEEIFSNKSEYRKFNSEFLVIIEKSIFTFNQKKYDESYKILLNESIIESDKEFGEFLLVVNGYDKNILGNFLVKETPPNKNKEIINSFINSIDLKYQQSDKINSFLECFRFFLSRLKLPSDANLILEIMDVYSQCYFNTNKDNADFVKKYSSINDIYLLISTILSLNTTLTRKDIKNMNVMKKEDFIKMNKEIDPEESKDIYEKLENKPLSMEDSYSENIYKRMSILVQKKNTLTVNRSKSFKETYENRFNKDKIVINDDINDNLKINQIIDNNDIIKIPEIEEEEKNNKKLPLSEKLQNKFQDIKNLDENDNNNPLDEFIRQPSFSYQDNLENFSELDKAILKKPLKFDKFISKSNHHPRFFIIYDNFQTLKWAKEIEFVENSDKTITIKKTKGKVHILMINEIEDVYNGINSELINQYINLFPEEKKERNNFITIKTSNKDICLKGTVQETTIAWFKALKSLVLFTRKNDNNQNMIIGENAKLKKNMKDKLKEFWDSNILLRWAYYYGHYLQYKNQNKITDKIKKEDSVSKNGLIEEKTTFSLKDKNQFLLDASKKLKENNNFLDYNEFFYLYNFGLPQKLRPKIWSILIGNPCGMNLSLYESYIGFIEDLNFEELIKDYEENKNIEKSLQKLDEDNKIIINQIIIDIIEIQKLFRNKIKNSNKVLKEVYRSVRLFFLMRPDICYHKSLVALSFIFILMYKDEFKSFKNLFNLIISTNTLQYYIKNENYIEMRVQFFDYLLENKMPKIKEHFKNLDISTELFLVTWFENIFSFTFDFKLLKKIFDLYLLNGEYILFKAGLAIIKVQENDLLNLTIGEALKNLKKMPAKYKEEVFFENLYSINFYEEYQKWRIDGDVGNQKIKLLELVLLEN